MIPTKKKQLTADLLLLEGQGKEIEDSSSFLGTSLGNLRIISCRKSKDSALLLDLLPPPFTVAPGCLFIFSSKIQGTLSTVGGTVLHHYISFSVETPKSKQAGLNNFSKPTNIL